MKRRNGESGMPPKPTRGTQVTLDDLTYIYRHLSNIYDKLKILASEPLPPAPPKVTHPVPAFANIWKETAEREARNAAYYRDIVVGIGKLLGPEARTADDGGLMGDVLCAKVLDIVASRLRRLERLESISRFWDRMSEILYKGPRL